VAENRIEIIAKKPVILLRRFDREGNRRLPFLSAMSMLGAKDNEDQKLSGNRRCAAKTRRGAERGYGGAMAAPAVNANHNLRGDW
jgi:hypothetical protein